MSLFPCLPPAIVPTFTCPPLSLLINQLLALSGIRYQGYESNISSVSSQTIVPD